jgi:hypothetical protein
MQDWTWGAIEDTCIPDAHFSRCLAIGRWSLRPGLWPRAAQLSAPTTPPTPPSPSRSPSYASSRTRSSGGSAAFASTPTTARLPIVTLALACLACRVYIPRGYPNFPLDRRTSIPQSRTPITSLSNRPISASLDCNRTGSNGFSPSRTLLICANYLRCSSSPVATISCPTHSPNPFHPRALLSVSSAVHHRPSARLTSLLRSVIARSGIRAFPAVLAIHLPLDQPAPGGLVNSCSASHTSPPFADTRQPDNRSRGPQIRSCMPLARGSIFPTSL